MTPQCKWLSILEKHCWHIRLSGLLKIDYKSFINSKTKFVPFKVRALPFIHFSASCESSTTTRPCTPKKSCTALHAPWTFGNDFTKRACRYQLNTLPEHIINWFANIIQNEFIKGLVERLLILCLPVFVILYV